ncbi:MULTISPECIES: protein-L-isoaspartate O-methyltransferase family protein [Legionella]|uniref:Protein-L-isoaspartate O-methyltransferase n=1 Tax=Legionella septentrionalis TaxID=2498109 RepID=A0A433JMA8_9GAMM|nr:MULTISPECIES: protein-L-isoaspartate O-methyltransferase [Legionella]MCP0913049.1 protein-L-isoaspartate O-methyltransferase [Legionella sp. 27cVA30]RUQ91504.1 protein-L-isoaspartate O-methyltransferase [Legionella septentrionalis]RUQ98492.1 protein-L-isoaspartate O-methyltransferase [Legionella septentrionalis]RUR10876.1 protein-L-isoaspartate O-methyltransferase [Legionella septentrionalis]RUR14590.1 protein-L-isoaspartate O-methyltransferase [Legionella septentrionalis]
MSSQIACNNMIAQQLRTGDVLDEKILDLFKLLPRENFVPNEFKSFAYSDMQIKLDHQQRMMTPLEEASLLQTLALKGNETVLEVGTGTGFLTALLSRLCKKVISIDYFADFTANAKRKLTAHDCSNVELLTGDASSGWLDKAPYDVVVFTGALEALTDTHRLQVLPGGRLFAIIGREPVMQAQLHELSHNGTWQAKLLFETNLPPLIDKLKRKEFVF